ncbi:hypothetical protein [Azoarcus sp. DD4]|uniref:hypothetical protein n=1 Tax=Azoarcus sp. DD4 TaxID=2027405 RepID=UPI001129C3F2|nr:hypothetical protein [Azoarcus sp. DD4]
MKGSHQFGALHRNQTLPCAIASTCICAGFAAMHWRFDGYVVAICVACRNPVLQCLILVHVEGVAVQAIGVTISCKPLYSG